jgi:hypothetical protein
MSPLYRRARACYSPSRFRPQLFPFRLIVPGATGTVSRNGNYCAGGCCRRCILGAAPVHPRCRVEEGERRHAVQIGPELRRVARAAGLRCAGCGRSVATARCGSVHCSVPLGAARCWCGGGCRWSGIDLTVWRYVRSDGVTHRHCRAPASPVAVSVAGYWIAV